MKVLRWTKPYIAPGLVMALAGIGFWTIFQSTRMEPSRLSDLVIQDSGLVGMQEKASRSEVVTSSQSDWSVVRKAAAAHPDQTGGYARTWEGARGGSNSLSILIEDLPTSWDSKLLRKQIMAEYTNAKTLKTHEVTITSRFSLLRVPGSQGVSYQETATNSSAIRGSTVVFAVGRLVVLVDVQTAASSSGGGGDIRSAAHNQYALLRAREPGYSMVEATRSPSASLVYGLIAVIVAASTVALPRLVQRGYSRRQARLITRASYGRQVRGSKVLRRRRASPLMQPTHRRR